MTDFMKFLVAVIVGLVGLLGLLASLCGGFFTVIAMNKGSTQWVPVAVPSLVIGGVIAWAALRYLTRSGRAANAAAPPPSQPPGPSGE